MASIAQDRTSGFGAADAAMHFECGAVDPAHTVIWHLGAVVVLSFLGALAGRFMPR